MRIVCVSDTHTRGREVIVPDGDVLIHAGDLTFRGTERELAAEFAWLESLPHRRKLVVAGNHDWGFDQAAPSSFRGWRLDKFDVDDFLARFPTLTYLQDAFVTIDGVKVYGSPWQPRFWDWAFNFPDDDGATARSTWAKIPDDTNVLVTHGPPRGKLDWTYPDDERAGCPELLARIQTLEHLRLHVFGHLHESYGREDFEAEDGRKLTFVNASINTRAYEPTNAPIVVEIEEPKR